MGELEGAVSTAVSKTAEDEEVRLDREAWNLARQLVGIDSSDPGAYEGTIEKWIFSWLQSKITETAGSLAGLIELKEREVLPGRSNVMARIPGRTKEPGLIYICHMDTVMLGDGWDEDTPALGAVVKEAERTGSSTDDVGRKDMETRLYGRGASLRHEVRSGLCPYRVCPCR